MIDIHSHILPDLDDGSPDLETSLAMAREAVGDGISAMVATPHRVPGKYDISNTTIEAKVKAFNRDLATYDIPLKVLVGCDFHIDPDMVNILLGNTGYRINGGRYFLFEPPHHVLPPNLAKLVKKLVNAGLVPILTHPERLSWIRSHYSMVGDLRRSGCLMQLTAGSLTGGFGSKVQAVSEKLLIDGCVDVVASDAHNNGTRPPVLSKAKRVVAQMLDDAAAQTLFYDNPRKIVDDEDVLSVSASVGLEVSEKIHSNSSIGAGVSQSTILSSVKGLLRPRDNR